VRKGWIDGHRKNGWVNLSNAIRSFAEEAAVIYHVHIEKGDDFGYIAHCPAIPGCHSQGKTLEEAIENIKDAIRGCIEALGEDLVTPPHETLLVEVEV
jgi:predicted RNase H-like HicB family nuclease